jgi:hypothetical protein
MPHLDDGQIAEWIDAAARPRGETTPGEVADHLRHCAVCRERVEQAQRVAERARAILGAAAPPVTEAPPFEVVLARAGRTTRRRRVGPPWRWLAWAATVVIAGGLGWYVRGAQPGPNSPTGRAAATAPESDSAGLLAAAEARQPQAVTGAVGGVAQTPAPGRPAASDAAPVREEKQQAVANAPAAAKVAPREAEADEALRDSGARAQALGAAPAAPGAAAAPAPGPPGNVVGATTVSEAQPAAPQLTITRDVAERLLGGPVATVPGLPVERYELLAPGRVVRVLQRLPSGAQLELHEWATAAAKPEGYVTQPQPHLDRVRAAAAERAPGDTVTLDGIRVTAQAQLPADSLRVLLGLIRR